MRCGVPYNTRKGLKDGKTAPVGYYCNCHLQVLGMSVDISAAEVKAQGVGEEEGGKYDKRVEGEYHPPGKKLVLQ